jgi:hypothetical protein
MERLMHSVGQAERNETVTKTMAELEGMEHD